MGASAQRPGGDACLENHTGVIYRRLVDPQPALPEPSRPDVVRPLSRAAVRTCARPGCPSPASATLTFAYDERRVALEDLAEDRRPDRYDLCAAHADRTGPPYGWTLEDRRRGPEVDTTVPPDGEATVALIARVLGRERDGHAPGSPGTERRVGPARVPSAPTAQRAAGRAPVQEAPPAGTQGRLFGGDRESDGGGRADAW